MTMQTTEQRNVRIGQLELRFLVDETDGAHDLVAFEFTIPAAARVPVPHYHRDVDELVYVLDGTVTVTIDGEARDVAAGESVFIPRGRVHHHANPHGQTARALVVLSPGSIGRRYFEEMAALVNGPGKPDPAAVTDVMRRHGLIPA